MDKYCFNCIDMLKNGEHTYKGIFKVYSTHKDMPAVEYRLDGQIKKLSFTDVELVSGYCADRILEKMQGVSKGFVCFKLANCPEWFEIFWGILMAGCCPFLIDARHDEKLTQYFIDEGGAVAIITNDGHQYENCLTIAASDIIKLDKRQILEIAVNADRTSKTAIERIDSYEWGNEVALCTSGTTSTAKIFIYNDEAIFNQVMNAGPIIRADKNICDDREKRMLCFLPLNHIFGFMANYLWYSFFGASQVLPDRMAPSVLLQTCRDHKVTHILAVPLLVNNIAKGIKGKLSKQSKFKQFMFNFMLNLSIFAQRIGPDFGIAVAKALFNKTVLKELAGNSIQCIICGGGHVLPESLRIINGIGYYTLCGFGMTEVGISSMERRRKIKYRLQGVVGVPVVSMEYKIVPFNDNDQSAGELVMRGGSIHSGMLKNGKHAPAATDEDGWFRSGDIGRLEKGALYIEGRLKEVVVNESGENVYPDELEDSFLNIEGVKAFTVLGINKGGGSVYEDIVIVCQTEPAYVDDPELTEKLRKEIAARNAELPVYKKLNYCLITKEDLPLSNGIKIRRVVIKREVEDGSGLSKYVKIEKLK
ncbi:MAG: AMP-binding protein [Clostridia bacterium]|nr:AMP-binding protein [Clostridia bacterium]